MIFERKVVLDGAPWEGMEPDDGETASAKLAVPNPSQPVSFSAICYWRG